jgi:hypothetical protein
MVAEYPIESFGLCGHRLRRLCGYHHPVGSFGRTRPHELSIYFDHAGITGLNGAELFVVTNMGDRHTRAVDQIKEPLFDLRIVKHIIDDNLTHFFTSRGLIFEKLPYCFDRCRTRERGTKSDL